MSTVFGTASGEVWEDSKFMDKFLPQPLRKLLILHSSACSCDRPRHQSAASSALDSSLYRTGNQHLNKTETLKGPLNNIKVVWQAVNQPFTLVAKERDEADRSFLSEMQKPFSSFFPTGQFLSCRIVSTQPSDFIEKWSWMESSKKQASTEDKGRKFLAIQDGGKIQ